MGYIDDFIVKIMTGNKGDREEIKQFSSFFSSLPHKHKIMIGF